MDPAGNLQDLHREGMIVKARNAGWETFIDRVGRNRCGTVAVSGLIDLHLSQAPGGERRLRSFAAKLLLKTPDHTPERSGTDGEEAVLAGVVLCADTRGEKATSATSARSESMGRLFISNSPRTCAPPDVYVRTAPGF